MDNNKLKHSLLSLGLSLNETDLLLVICQSSPLTVLELSRKTNIKRTTVYRLLEKLIDKRLIKKTSTKNSTKYYSEGELSFKKYISYQKKNLINKRSKVQNIINQLNVSLVNIQTINSQHDLKIFFNSQLPKPITVILINTKNNLLLKQIDSYIKNKGTIRLVIKKDFNYKKHISSSTNIYISTISKQTASNIKTNMIIVDNKNLILVGL